MAAPGSASPRPKPTVPGIRATKRRDGDAPLVMVTAYDAPTARLAHEAGVDMLLVGDSVGTALLGYESTVPVTMEDILHHARAVRRGAPEAHVVVDLPFMSYQVSDEQAVTNAGRLMKEGGADAVKLEGGIALASRIRAITAAGIPVVGHIGLTPQTAGALGGLKVQGRDEATARALIADALAVEAAGAYALVIEVVPAPLGTLITEQLRIPTIGIGAGAECDGQVLVWTDLAGLDAGFVPKFVRRYADLSGTLRAAFATFADEVRSGAYPAAEHTYPMKPEVAAALRESLEIDES
ncbi:MAG TPA: 3-methyl-2-oxobutanoate hydroxymethyltransferase [Thermomicrobiales bacterium]|nr:3-methyl-2-oxobutanoate hydroxymethyltransferase [Thermomicrobiales bacterium]